MEKYPYGSVIQNDATMRQGTPWKIVLTADPDEGPPDALIADAVAYWVHEHYQALLVFNSLAIRVEEVHRVHVNGTHRPVRRITIEGVDTWGEWKLETFPRSMNDLTAAIFRVGDFAHFAHLAYGDTTWEVQFSEGKAGAA